MMKPIGMSSIRTSFRRVGTGRRGPRSILGSSPVTRPGSAAGTAPEVRTEWTRRPPILGVLGAVVFFAGSLVPSLLPRPWHLQAIVSAMGFALGVGFGSTLQTLFRWASRVRPGQGSRKAALLALAVAGGILVGWSLVIHHRWQVDVRRLMGMDTEGVLLYLAAAVTAGLAGGCILVLLARAARSGFRAYRRILGRIMPAVLSVVVAVSTTLLALVLIVDVLIAERLFTAINEAYLASDRRFDVEVVPPTSSHRAGGPGSAIEWETMGRQGRAFVTQGPDLADLQRFHGEPGREPIRVYAGLQSAADPSTRAELAASELERAGAFEREVLVLIAPTGTGWIDPYAVTPLEYLHNGDTAAVAIQYSHLPSWVLMIGNQDVAVAASRALFDAVSERLEQRDPSERPLLLLYGESLGSFGFERLFDGLDEVRAATDGVLWVGPPRSNRIWHDLTENRRTGSPVWRPVYGDGEEVRFGADGEALTAVDTPWQRPRVGYLQHASDPITWWTPALLFEPPEWMDHPRGPDVSEQMPYVPVVTFWQVAVDLVMGTNAPHGHGHKFGLGQAEAWALIAPPEGWSSADTGRLLSAVAGHAE